MPEALNSVGAITLFVDDPRRSQEFYERVFGARLIYQDEDSAAFGFEHTIVNLLSRAAARTLVDPAPVGDSGAGARFQLTIWVDDADAACRALAERGVRLLNGPVDREWGVRTASFQDPDGHVWELAQQLGAGG